jgi:hypothetical protein
MQFLNLRLKQTPHKVAPDPSALSASQLLGDYALPISIRAVNSLPPDAKQRIYRMLIPPSLLTRVGIHPITWRATETGACIDLDAAPDTGAVKIIIRDSADSSDALFTLDLSDNAFNGIDLHFLLLSDPASERFRTDVDAQGHATLFGTTYRNRAEEERAMRAGLAPAQIRASLGMSQWVLHQLDAFLTFLSHHAISLEPLTYASAWVFERRGFAYMRGHKLMDDIEREFQVGGKLRAALDGSSPFRQPDQWQTIRGRAWAIHDGILEAMDARWNDLRMVKQVGKHAGVNTAPDVAY